MLRKYLYGIFAFVLALGILSVSFLRLSSLSFAFSPTNSPPPLTPEEIPNIDYTITLPGKIMPDSILWPLEATRDRVWYFLTRGHLRKAELALFFSDKRLMSGKSLFESNNAELGMSTLTKGEKYLETALYQETIAREEGEDTSGFLINIAQASLKHREIIQKNIFPIAPEQARPHLEVVDGKIDLVFHAASERLGSLGKEVPKDPFERQD
jgi:hypothetical protein